MKMNQSACITGIGETPYSKGSDKNAFQLQLQASILAIKDAGIQAKEIDGVIPIGIVSGTSDEFIENLGLPDLKFSAQIPHGGASPVMALQCAKSMLESYVCKHILITFGRNVSASAHKAGSRIHQMQQFHYVTEFEYPLGNVAPAQIYAPMAKRYMELYGVSSEQFAEVAIVCRENAILSGQGLMKNPITLEDHQNSRMIAEPFRLLDCCLESDGGAAIIVSRADVAKDTSKHLIRISSVAEGHPDSPGSITQRPDMTSLGIAKAAKRAFAQAGVTHQDIDLAQIYDCFTYAVIRQLEDLGFCAKGEGGTFIQNGRIRLGGELPINTHGGLMSQAHVWGLNHTVELVRQLRHDGKAAQVKNAKIGLVTGYGDLGDGALAILCRD